MTVLNKLMLVIVGLFFASILVACSGGSDSNDGKQTNKIDDPGTQQSNSGDDQNSAQQSSSRPKVDEKAMRAQLVYTAPEKPEQPETILTQAEAVADAESKDKELNGKYVEITAKVTDFSFSDQGLIDKNPEATFFRVICFDDDLKMIEFRFYEGQPWTQFNVNEEVTIRGFWSSATEGMVFISHCNVVKSSGNGVQPLSDDVLKAADEGDFYDYFSNRKFIVSGTVSELDKKAFGDTKFVLTSENGKKFFLNADALDWGFIENDSEIIAMTGTEVYREEGKIIVNRPVRLDIFK